MSPPGFCTRRQTFLFQIPQRKDPASVLPGQLHNRLPVRTQTLLFSCLPQGLPHGGHPHISFHIKTLLDNGGKVSLFTRPRRFGKSLNMSMLRSFFEIGTDPALFAGLYISQKTELCKEYMGKYPVISISL